MNPTTLPLEDTFSDILGKAARAQGVEEGALGRLALGEWDPALAETVCRRLGLSFPALAAIAEGRWRPTSPALPDGLAGFTTPFGDMTVNAFLVWDRATGAAAVFDTGGDASALLAEVTRLKVRVKVLFLTHTHGDHVLEVDRVAETTGCQVLAPEGEPLAGAEMVRSGETVAVGGLQVEARPTPGHSPGGTTYLVHGLRAPVAVVGDAIFAGSVGGIRGDYAAALEAIRREILSRQDNTLLCPGHGPLTTVGQERAHNPFFA
ncbi:MAG: MBL fold metallo-hydrolase [Verrucomicrobiia bacterium]